MMHLQCLSDHQGSLLKRSVCNITTTSCLAPVQTFLSVLFLVQARELLCAHLHKAVWLADESRDKCAVSWAHIPE